MIRLRPRSRPIIGAVIVLGTFLTLNGCATRSKVSASNEMATAMFAIRDARANGAETYSMETLGYAEQLLDQARETSGAEAERLAELALAQAQLANVVALREGARKKLAEAQRMEREAAALRERTTSAVEERLR